MSAGGHIFKRINNVTSSDRASKCNECNHSWWQITNDIDIRFFGQFVICILIYKCIVLTSAISSLARLPSHWRHWSTSFVGEYFNFNMISPFHFLNFSLIITWFKNIKIDHWSLSLFNFTNLFHVARNSHCVRQQAQCEIAANFVISLFLSGMFQVDIHANCRVIDEEFIGIPWEPG